MSEPADTVLGMVRGAWVTLAVRGASVLGVFDELDAPASADDLARRTSCDAPTLARLLRVLVDLGLLERDEAGDYRNTELGAVLRQDHPGRLCDLLLMQATVPNLAAWAAIDDAVRDGGSVYERVNRVSHWDYLAQNPEAQSRFNASMARRGAGQVSAVLAATDLTGDSSLVDVGGGRGAMVAGLLDAAPALRAQVADQAAMAEEADALFAARGLADRASGAACDFFVSVPEGADVYTIANVLHDWDDEDSVAILRTVRRAMPDRARLLVVEHVLDAPGRSEAERRDLDLVDLHMLLMFGARERTQAEYDDLLTASGFTRSTLADTGTDWNVLEARPAG